MNVDITTGVYHRYKHYAIYYIVLPKFCAVYLLN